MVFWIAILVGCLFVWLAVRIGFYETWVLCFNIIVSVYLAIFLAPTVVEFAPGTGSFASYCMALSLMVLAGGCFAILQGLSFVFLTGQFNIPFPRVFDIVLSGLLGFLAGFLVLSFVALAITTTPLAEHEMVSGIGLNERSQQTNLATVAWCCDLVHSFAQPNAEDQATHTAVERLLEAHPTTDGSQGPDPNGPSTFQPRDRQQQTAVGRQG